MTRAISNRLRRLERSTGRGCPACGGGGREAWFEVFVPEAVGRVADRGEPPESRPCGVCGREAGVVIRFPEARPRRKSWNQD